ncbi:Peptidyl-prolyl cis-trans isomerase A [Durusdinium trenchii]|uniref:Peptidyl-prolyl cis-trans isomerase A n=1 Tax=Durusdinium trenchii TaxID=1381693 RepID=A0ABP0Q2K7_9DINO
MADWVRVGPLRASTRSWEVRPVACRRLLERLTAAAEWTTQELTFVPESRTPMTSVSAGYPPALRAFEEPTEGPAEQVQVDQGSAETSSARGQSEAEPMKSPMNSPRTVAVTGVPVSEKPWEVTVDDEPEVFLEMIRFVYLNTCHVDQGNVKALMHIADKYCIEDIVKHCLQWMQDNFTVARLHFCWTITCLALAPTVV